MNKDLVVGIDCSTTSSKVIVWDSTGNRVASGRAPLDTITPRPLWHEQSAEAWWEATTQAMQDAAGQINADRLAALCLTNQRETFVPVDGTGAPLRNAILWMDERAGDLLPDLEERYGREVFHHRTGKPLSGNLSLAKIAWLREHEPEVIRKTAKILDVQAFLIHKLTGQYQTGWGSADPMGLFDMGEHQWASDLLDDLGLTPEQFPQAFPPGQIVGEVSDRAAGECSLPAGLPVVAGVGDGQSAALGANITAPGRSCLSLGTSVVSGSFAPDFHVSPYFRTTYAAIPGAYLLETVILGGAYTIHWFIENFFDTPIQDRRAEDVLEAEAQQTPPGADGLMLVPYWNSTMNPYWDAKASGVVVGWRGIHRRGHFYRAILEGIAFEQRLHTEGVETALGEGIRSYVVMGGGARSDLWCQVIADICGKPVFRAGEEEAAALGAGILAACAAEMYADASEAADAMTHISQAAVEPDAERHDRYTRLYEDVYRHLYPSLSDKLSRLTDLSDSALSAS